jgi:hypothetical protein
MAAETIRRSLALFMDLHNELPPIVDLVLNQFSAGEPLAAEMAAIAAGSISPFKRIFTIPNDPQLASFERSGRSLLELSPVAPAMAALGVWEIGL